MSIVNQVMAIIKRQQDKGLKKYGVSVDKAQLSAIEWIEHAQEEAADLMMYLECLKRELLRGESDGSGSTQKVTECINDCKKCCK